VVAGFLWNESSDRENNMRVSTTALAIVHISMFIVHQFTVITTTNINVTVICKNVNGHRPSLDVFHIGRLTVDIKIFTGNLKMKLTVKRENK